MTTVMVQGILREGAERDEMAMATTPVVKSPSTTLVGRSARREHCRRGHVPEAPAARRPTTGTRGRPGMAADMNGAPSVNAVAARPHRRRHTSLYGANYTARVIGRRAEGKLVPSTVVGRHCEAGDILARNVPLPVDVHPGDMLAMPCSGAYHHSLASNYNLVGRPPIVAVRDGSARVLVRRETAEDLLARDMGY